MRFRSCLAEDTESKGKIALKIRCFDIFVMEDRYYNLHHEKHQRARPQELGVCTKKNFRDKDSLKPVTKLFNL